MIFLVFSQARDEEEAFLDWSDEDDGGFDPSTLPDPDKHRSSEESESEDTNHKMRYVLTLSLIKYEFHTQTLSILMSPVMTELLLQEIFFSSNAL